MSIFNPFQLLELNIISGQDLAPVSRRMKTYAVAWVNSDRKLTTRVDYTGGTNPTWNDKFVFRVNEEFLYADTSAVMIEIYALHWFRDVHVGTVRVLISNLIPPNRRPGYRNAKDYHNSPPQGMWFVALQVRRASGRPQGILNIGVGLLDGSMRSMPLYTNLSSSAVGYRDLMGHEDPHLQHLHLNSHKTPASSRRNPQSPASRQLQSIVSKPELRRTKSDTSSIVESDLLSRMERTRAAKRQAPSLVGSDSSVAFSSDVVMRNTNNEPRNIDDQPPKVVRKRFDSIESEVLDPSNREKTKTYPVPHHEPRRIPRMETPSASPYLSSKQGTPLRSNIVGSTPIRSNRVGSTPARSNYIPTPMRSSFMAAKRPILTESELGPSPSELAAQRAAAADADSSILSEWSIDASSVEGLRSKLDRWRSELPPLYDFGSSNQSSSKAEAEEEAAAGAAAGGRSNRMKKKEVVKRESRRRSEGDEGKFSCFGNICGLECSIVCGSKNKKKAGAGPAAPVRRTISAGNLNYI